MIFVACACATYKNEWNFLFGISCSSCLHIYYCFFLYDQLTMKTLLNISIWKKIPTYHLLIFFFLSLCSFIVNNYYISYAQKLCFYSIKMFFSFFLFFFYRSSSFIMSIFFAKLFHLRLKIGKRKENAK